MKKLRWKLVRIVFFSVVAVFAVMNILLIVCLNVYNNRQADQMTQIICENNGTVPLLQEYEQWQSDKQILGRYFNEFNEESAFRTRYFRVLLDSSRQITGMDMDHIAAVDENQAENMTKRAVNLKAKVGHVGSYRFRKEYEDGTLSAIIFLDCKETKELHQLVVTLTGSVSVLLIGLITAIFIVASKRVVRPFEENSERQKQFITDASHELKTPLAIISANAEVLQYKGEQNEWIQNIMEQTKRMGKLINQLLTLAKLEEVQEDQKIQEVELGSLIRETAEAFAEVADQKHATWTFDLADNVCIRANREQMEQLITILTDNATKYVNENGQICWSLSAGSHGAGFSIKNTTDEKLTDAARLFDRFYRSDSSRSSQTGGYGIGLSIAKKIVDRHKGSIGAKEEGQEVVIYGTLSSLS